MPVPVTAAQLFVNIRKSGLVPDPRLDEFAARTPPSDSPAAVIAKLAAAGLLTPFQAERVAAGKYKGFVLGGYVILDKIGGGGMGQVFLAEHAAMRRHVAIKVLPLASAADPVARERFYREARSAAALDHPHIIRVHDLRKEGQVLYLVMEFIEGLSLQAYVVRAGPLPAGAAANYARQVADGLTHAHANGLVHRDIKPANLLLGHDGTVKILDLGLVRSEADEDSKLTEKVDQAILGTADYLAPEQAVNSHDVDSRADVYSLGATLYYLLAGRPMFPDGRVAQKLMWQQLREPPPVSQVRPDVPPGLAAVVHKALQKKPADRYPTAAAMAAALAPWADLPADPPSAAVMPPPPVRWLAARPAVAAVPAGEDAVPASSAGTTAAGGGSSHLLTVPKDLRLPDAATLDDRNTFTPPVVPPSRRLPPLPHPAAPGVARKSGLRPPEKPPAPDRRAVAVGVAVGLLLAAAAVAVVVVRSQAK